MVDLNATARRVDEMVDLRVKEWELKTAETKKESAGEVSLNTSSGVKAVPAPTPEQKK